MVANRKKLKKQYSVEEMYNPQIDLTRDACLYGRQSSKDQVVQNVQSHISQTIMLLAYTKELGFKEDGTTGKVTLFVENEVVDVHGNTSIRNASGTWPIDQRPGLKAICDLIERGSVGVVISEFVDRLFRDEDRIDSNIFIKICKENGCFVHISSKRMTYNFANDQHAEMFRLEVQMAAFYIKNHVKGTMLRRRDMLVKTGQWGGIGAVPVGYIVCSDDKSSLYGKFTPYEPHAKIVLWIFTRFIELGYDFAALRKEIREMSVVFPAFLPGVRITHFMLTPTKNGYLISKDALEYILTNEVYIGTFRRQVQDGEVYIEKNHPAIVPEEIFWLVYDHLKDVRPDGTSTGRIKQVRYSQKTIGNSRLPLLKVVSGDGNVYWHDIDPHFEYKVVKRDQLGLSDENIFCVSADVLEAVVVKRLFERLHTIDLQNLNEQRAARNAAISKKIKELQREIETIDEDINALTENLKKIKTPAVVKELEKQMAKSIDRRSDAKIGIERLKEALKKDVLGTLEEELDGLENLWEFKSFTERKALLNLLIKTLSVNFLTPHFYSVEIQWSYDNWGVESTIFHREMAGSKNWTEEEIMAITNLYPSAPQLELMRVMPNRTYQAIYTLASKMGIVRRVKLPIVYPKFLSLKDVEFLEQNNLTAKDFKVYKYKLTFVNRTEWSLRLRL